MDNVITPIDQLVSFVGVDGQGYRVYEVVPGVMYPAMNVYAQAAVRGEVQAYGGQAEFLEQAKKFSDSAWRLANVGIDKIEDNLERALREEVLELLRRWFTRRLKEYVGQPIGIRILKDDFYRLTW